jgi:membrane protease YdiL (CAAX protease family)
VEAAGTRPSYVRLAVWSSLALIFIVLAYLGPHGKGTETVYSYKAFAENLAFYALWLGVVLLIAIDRFDLLAIRAPRWRQAFGGMAIAALVIVVADVATLPLNPGKEQGLTPTHWEPAHLGAFIANVFVFTMFGPFVEELTFRGEGQSLLRFLGRAPSIVLVGVSFGLLHGLVAGELVLIPFGIALAWLRDRTDSVLPGVILHGLFNGGSLAAAVLLN